LIKIFTVNQQLAKVALKIAADFIGNYNITTYLRRPFKKPPGIAGASLKNKHNE